MRTDTLLYDAICPVAAHSVFSCTCSSDVLQNVLDDIIVRAAWAELIKDEHTPQYAGMWASAVNKTCIQQTQYRLDCTRCGSAYLLDL